ncbi:MAG: apolipoprotein N-acyltransferase [Pseudomonadota bacterium]
MIVFERALTNTIDSMRRFSHPFAAVLAGALTPLGIAPFHFSWLAIITLSVLAFLLHRQLSKKQLLLRTFLFGLGYFGVGASWVFISIYHFGSASLPLALLLTTLFVTFVALVFALPFTVLHYFQVNQWRLLLGFPLVWGFSEWLRSWIFTGFPWAYIGYSQLQTPLVGWAPVGGIFLLGLFCALSSSVLYLLFIKHINLKYKWLSAVAVMIIWAQGLALTSFEWTEPAGKGIKVGIVQPNIPQELKWSPDYRQPTLNILEGLSDELWQQDWIIWPEAAVPDVYSRAEDFIAKVHRRAQQTQTSLLTGILYDDDQQQKYFNSMIGLGDARGIYFKQRLVPFGEYVPLEAWLRGLIQFFDLPTSVIAPGMANQALIQAGNYTIASAICYEIVYPSLVAKQARYAHAIITISNDAWFGHSIGPLQHFHMARMRAIETGRYLVRSTNNGISAIIDKKGNIIEQSDQFVRTYSTGEIIPMEGNTPYIIWQNTLFLALLALMAVLLCAFETSNRRR